MIKKTTPQVECEVIDSSDTILILISIFFIALTIVSAMLLTTFATSFFDTFVSFATMAIKKSRVNSK